VWPRMRHLYCFGLHYTATPQVPLHSSIIAMPSDIGSRRLFSTSRQPIDRSTRCNARPYTNGRTWRIPPSRMVPRVRLPFLLLLVSSSPRTRVRNLPATPHHSHWRSSSRYLRPGIDSDSRRSADSRGARVNLALGLRDASGALAFTCSSCASQRIEQLHRICGRLVYGSAHHPRSLPRCDRGLGPSFYDFSIEDCYCVFFNPLVYIAHVSDRAGPGQQPTSRAPLASVATFCHG